MRKSTTKYNTVVIFDKNQPHARTLTVRSKHIDRWKWYLISAIIFLALIFTALFFYAREAKRNERAAILLEKYRQEVLKPMAIDTNVAKSYIEKIDKKLERLEKYLKQRGVELTAKFTSQRKKVRASRQAIQTYVFYEAYLSDLYAKAQFVPMGYPCRSEITSQFGFRTDPFGNKHGAHHSGIDISGHQGDNIRATANGVVTLADWYYGYGKCIIVKHKYGYATLYGHLSKIMVKQGQQVKAGECIGLMGSTGHSTGNHLHYEVHRYNKTINPMRYLKV